MNESQVIGFDYAPTFCTFNEINELELIWVHKDWRSRGYARFMLKKLEWFRGDDGKYHYYDIITVNAVEDSIDFWKHMEFEIDVNKKIRYDGTTVMLNTNYIPCMSSSLTQFPKDTQEVDLSRKRINQMDWEWCPDSLKQIKLRYNEIQEMTWEGCPDTLQEIDLSNNKIAKMNLKGCPKGLQKVILRNNNLVELDWEGCPKKLEVRVGGNKNIRYVMSPEGVYCAS